jgi:hypothetical protein
MYASKSGSLKTTLSADLDSSGNSAAITELAALPAAPNLVTFQTDDTIWETCVYSVKSAATGAGTITIARSGAGHASYASDSAVAWTAGAKVSRMPTGYDHDTFIANVGDHETRILAVESLDINATEVTDTSQAAAINKCYILNNEALVTVTLPASAVIGSKIEIRGKGAGGFKIAQNASQYIHFGNLVSTTGTGGYVASTNAGDTLTLECITADVGWRVCSPTGILDVV